MKSSSSNILLIIGGCLIVAPLAFIYLSYRLSAQVLAEAMAHGRQWDKVDFHPAPPEYYFPVCLLLGVLCIGIGVFLSQQDRNRASVSAHTGLNLS